MCAPSKRCTGLRAANRWSDAETALREGIVASRQMGDVSSRTLASGFGSATTLLSDISKLPTNCQLYCDLDGHGPPPRVTAR